MPMINFEIDDSLDFTTTTESTASIRVPKLDFVGMVLNFTYTVTDSGISAGENIAGAIKRLMFQAPGFKDEEPIDIRKNEIADIIELLNPMEQPGTQLYIDATPSTGTEKQAWFYLPWSYAGTKYSDNLVVNLTMDFINEFAGVSAVNCSCKIGLVTGSSATSVVIKRNSRAATTGDDVPAPSLPYNAVLIKTTTAGDLSYINVPSGPSFRNPKLANQNWGIYTDGASAVSSKYYMLTAPRVSRTDSLRVEGSTSEARDVWYVCGVNA